MLSSTTDCTATREAVYGRSRPICFRRAADESLPPLTLPSPLLFRCAGRGEGIVESAARLRAAAAVFPNVWV